MVPYVIRRQRTGRIAVGIAVAALLGVGASGLAAAPAFADASISSSISWCSAPALTQPFLAWGDQNEYALLPGESSDSFDGSGWSLSGGANIVSAGLYDGTTGPVLDLPSGSEAVSPAFCVNSSFQDARTMVDDVAGDEGVQVYVSYQGTSTWHSPENVGLVNGQQNSWTLSDSVSLQPPPDDVWGWRLARITLIPGGQTSEFQIYDLYVDPYSK